MSDVIQFTKIIFGVFEKAGYFVQKVLQNGINISGNVFGQCSFAGNNWSAWWSYFKPFGYLRDLLSIYECFIQMRMIIFGRDELFIFFYVDRYLFV